MTDRFRFDPVRHVYTIDATPVPSTTQVVRALLPGWQAAEWYLQAGSCVHAAAAFIAQGKDFELDLSGQTPEDQARINGRILAARRFFAEVRPVVLSVERQVYHPALGYAGTYDLYCLIGDKAVLVDYKSGHDTDRTRLQLGGYALAMDPCPVAYGYEVVLGEDGRYSMSARQDLKAGRREFAALLSAWKIRERFGANPQKEEVRT